MWSYRAQNWAPGGGSRWKVGMATMMVTCITDWTLVSGQLHVYRMREAWIGMVAQHYLTGFIQNPNNVPFKWISQCVSHSPTDTPSWFQFLAKMSTSHEKHRSNILTMTKTFWVIFKNIIKAEQKVHLFGNVLTGFQLAFFNLSPASDWSLLRTFHNMTVLYWTTWIRDDRRNGEWEQGSSEIPHKLPYLHNPMAGKMWYGAYALRTTKVGFTFQHQHYDIPSPYTISKRPHRGIKHISSPTPTLPQTCIHPWSTRVGQHVRYSETYISC